MSYRLGLAAVGAAPQERGLYFLGNRAQSRIIRVGDGGLGGTGILADVQAEISQLDSEMKALNSELFNGLPATTTDPKFVFYSSVWRPFAEQWQDFRDNKIEKSFANLARSLSILGARGIWKDLQEYRGRLNEMFDKAKDAGFKLLGPEPTKPRKSTFEDAADFTSGLLKFLKTLLYIAIGLGVGYLLFQVVKEWRHP